MNSDTSFMTFVTVKRKEFNYLLMWRSHRIQDVGSLHIGICNILKRCGNTYATH